MAAITAATKVNAAEDDTTYQDEGLLMMPQVENLSVADLLSTANSIDSKSIDDNSAMAQTAISANA